MKKNETKNEKIKIAVIGTRGLPATYGGVEKACEELYSKFTENNYQVVLYARNYYTTKGKKEYRGIKLKTIPIINIKGLETFFHSFISTIMATFSDATVIHFHAQGPALFSFIPRLIAPNKLVVFTCHGIDWQRDKWSGIAKFVIKLGEKASALFPHVKIGVSQYLTDYYSQKYGIKMHTIPNGINISAPVEIKHINSNFGLNKKDYFLFVGRLVPEKAIDDLIKAFKLTKTDKKLVIAGGSAGTDDYVKELKNLAKDDKRIIFTSFVYGETLAELYSNAIAYVSASKLEGLPLTLLEAMSYKLPVILSNIEPHTEPLAYEPKAGMTFPVSNIEACKNAIETFLALEPDEQSAMGLDAKTTVIEHYNWQNAYLTTLSAYKQD